MKNSSDYVLVSFDFYRAIPPPYSNQIDVNLIPGKGFETQYNIDYKAFNEFLYPIDTKELVFTVEKYFHEKDLETRKKSLSKNYSTDPFKERLSILIDEIDIISNLENKLEFDYKTEKLSDKSKFIFYYKKVKRLTFQREEYLYFQGIFKNTNEWCRYYGSRHYHCLKEDMLFLYTNLEKVLCYTLKNSLDPEYLKYKKSKPSKRDLEELLLNDFVEGKNYFDIEEFWNLSNLSTNKSVQEFLNQ